MRLSCVNLCLNLLKERGITTPNTNLQVIDVGGTKVLSVDGGAKPNPLFEYFPNLVTFDGGFTVDHFQTESDYVGDITDWRHGLYGKFDIVLCFDTLEHVPNPFVFTASLAYLAKVGGLVFIAAPFQWEYHPSPQDYFRYTPEGLAEVLKGLEVADVTSGWVDTTHVYVIAKAV